MSEVGRRLGENAAGSAAAEDVIVLESVSKRFGDFLAVRDTDLAIAGGEFFAMLGPSGCGKTTTLKMIAGFEQPTGGRIMLAGEDVSRVPPHKRNVNTVFQQYALFPHMTVADNVAFGPRSQRVPKEVYRPRVDEMLDVVRLRDFAGRKPAQLSGGQQQRVALARALVNYPSALLLDEPLAALDLKLREAMQLELKRIQREVGITFVFVTHDQGEALTMSDRIAVMNEGTIDQVGTPEEIYYRPTSLFVAGFIGSANLLPGTMIGRDGRDVTVALASGAHVRAGSGVEHGPGAHVSVMVRPERLRVLGSPGEADGHAGGDGRRLKGTVTQMIFQGATARLHVELSDGTVLVANIDPDDDVGGLRPGAAVELGWRPGGAFALPGWPDHAGVTSTDVDQVEASL